MPKSIAAFSGAEAFGEQAVSIWGLGATFLWTLTSASSVILLALLAASIRQLGEAEELLVAYGGGLALAISVLTLVSTLTTFIERTVLKRTSRALVLIPNGIQSHCLRSKQSGNLMTRITLYFQAKNISNDSVKLSKIRLVRPVVRQRQIRETTLSVRSPASSAFGAEFPISPHLPTQGWVTFVIDRPIGHAGKAIRAVVFIQDNLGQWYKLVFSDIKMIGTR